MASLAPRDETCGVLDRKHLVTDMPFSFPPAHYVHPKLNAVGFVREVDTFASRLERAAARSDPKGEYYARFTKMIEARAVEVPASSDPTPVNGEPDPRE